MKVLIFLYFFVCSFSSIKAFEPTWDSLDSRPLPEWFDEAKFGIFINWGVYTVPGKISEWFWWRWQGDKTKEAVEFMEKNFPPNFTYADFGPMFRQEFYDPEYWAKLVKRSGAKYVVPSSKHHEGFTLYPSNYSWNWNSKDVGPNRDLIGDLRTAFDKFAPEIRFGLYFSFFEWFNPIYINDRRSNFQSQEYVEMVSWPQLFEIVNAYKPEILWSDGAWEAPDTYWKSKEFLAWLYNESPVKNSVVVNDRWGSGIICNHGGYYTCNDNFNPGTLQKHKWENCFPVDSVSYGYRRDMNYWDVMTIEAIIEQLASTISCGGNILMNISPTADGRIAPIFQERLYQIGDFLAVNGEAVFKSKPWIHQNDTLTPKIWYTSQLRNSNEFQANRFFNPQIQENTIVYAFLLQWPPNNLLQLGAPKISENTTVTMLGVRKSLNFKQMSEAKGILIDLSTISFNEIPKVHGWVLKFQNLANESRNPLAEMNEV